MKMKKILIFGIAVLITTVIIISGCLENPDLEKPKIVNNIVNNSSVIEPNEKIIHGAIEYTLKSFGDIQKNSEIQFKVGDKFLYQSDKEEATGSYGNTTYFVEGIKKVGDRECYLVSETDDFFFIEYTGARPQILSRTNTLCYDKETGKVLQVALREDGKEFIIKDGADEMRAMHSFFAFWMLGLHDDAKWEILFTEITPSLNLTENLKAEFRVLGREKINNRECFKVELRYVDLDKKEVTDIDYYYIDVKKRIVVRWERYTKDMVKYAVMDLISEL